MRENSSIWIALGAARRENIWSFVVVGDGWGDVRNRRTKIDLSRPRTLGKINTPFLDFLKLVF